MADTKLEQGMKNHPGFMPFTHCNTSSNVEEIKNDTKEKKDTDK